MWQREAPGENVLHIGRTTLSLVSNTGESVNHFLYRPMCVTSMRTANYSNISTISHPLSQCAYQVGNCELTIPPEPLSDRSLV